VPDTNSKTVAIIGQGYVGLPLAMAAIRSGWTVIGIDNSIERVRGINSGQSPVEDVSDEELDAALSSKLFIASSDFSEVSKASVVTICVPTPLNINREPDLSMLEAAALAIAPNLSDKTLVISESTSFPGTLRDYIIPLIENLKANQGNSYFYASAPERVNPGDKQWNQRNTPRLVGSIDEESAEAAMGFYSSICDSAIRVATPEIAEAAKLLENTFRLTNIALVNEFAKLCSSANIDINQVIDAASTKPYGYMEFRPGVGVGGHCIPVDPLYLTWWARKIGMRAELVETADSINSEMPSFVASKALEIIGDRIQNPRVLVLGVAYKAGIADVRESPVSGLIDALRGKGAEVAWHDPLVKFWNGKESEAITWPCDIAIVATNQPGLEIELLLRSGTRILDCTNSFSSYEKLFYL
jgi:UDP-N-acetyl-D-glucosamine dehydrogenase